MRQVFLGSSGGDGGDSLAAQSAIAAFGGSRAPLGGEIVLDKSAKMR